MITVVGGVEEDKETMVIRSMVVIRLKMEETKVFQIMLPVDPLPM